jgi:hypothetical protein
MSHIVTIKTKVRDPAALAAAHQFLTLSIKLMRSASNDSDNAWAEFAAQFGAADRPLRSDPGQPVGTTAGSGGRRRTKSSG